MRYTPKTATTVAIFPPEMIASVASIKPRNIVPLSPMRNFCLISKNQNTAILQRSIRDIFIINSAF
jgi:hypothetical protein